MLNQQLENTKKENSGVYCICTEHFYVMLLTPVITDKYYLQKYTTIFVQIILFSIASHRPPAIKRF